MFGRRRMTRTVRRRWHSLEEGWQATVLGWALLLTVFGWQLL